MDGMSSPEENAPTHTQVSTKPDAATDMAAAELGELVQREKQTDAALVAKAEKRRRRLTEFLPQLGEETQHTNPALSAEAISPSEAVAVRQAVSTDEAPPVSSDMAVEPAAKPAKSRRSVKKPHNKHNVDPVATTGAGDAAMPSENNSSDPHDSDRDTNAANSDADQPESTADAALSNDGGPVDQPSAAAEGSDQERPPAEIHPFRVVEAILMASDVPLTPAKIAVILGIGTAKDVRKHVETLNDQYESLQMSIRVREIAGGYQIYTLPEYDRWLSKLSRARQETKLTGAALETLAIIAYKQPCTRADVEAIRGVAAGDLINRLREMNLVKITGRAEDLGRPLLYGTTPRFLETFGLPSLEDLPQVEALKSGAKPAPVRTEPTTDVAKVDVVPESQAPTGLSATIEPEHGAEP